jgi:hypothetical protein
MQTLNAVAPDCDGNVTVAIQGCAQIGQVLQGGIVLDCVLSLADACLPSSLPTSDGVLPNEYVGGCASESYMGISEISQPSESIPTPEPAPSQPSDSVETMGTLPYLLRFDHDLAPYGWTTMQGATGFVNDFPAVPETPPLTQALTTVNHTTTPVLAIWNGWDTQSVNRVYTGVFKIVSGGGKNNAALVFNYQVDANGSGLTTWYAAVLDYDQQQFSIQYWNGVNLVSTATVAQLNNVQLNQWYRVMVTVQSGVGTSVDITAVLNIVGDATLVTLGPLPADNYAPGAGMPGFYTNRSAADLSFILITEL